MEESSQPAFESIFPSISFSDHYLINYLAAIARQYSDQDTLPEFATPVTTAPSDIEPLVADFHSVSMALGEAKIVTRSAEGLPQFVTSYTRLDELAKTIRDSNHRTDFVRRAVRALQELQTSSDEVHRDVFHSPSNQTAALMQSVVDRRASAEKVLEIPFDGDDVSTILGTIHDQILTPHPLLRPLSEIPDPISDNARVFLVSDFGTGLYGAPVTAKTIRDSNETFDLLLHLGDIYYSGQTSEIQERFLDVWPTDAGKVSRTLNGNHEMYSGGFGYFDLALPRFGQKSSYFAFQNARWLLIGLDTAWTDNEIDEEQVAWIENVVKHADPRRVVLFSHHPLFSTKKDPLKNGQDLHDGLRELLVKGKIFAWYWGHEHHCIVYDRHPIFRLYGRCIGHGGMPYKRKGLKDLEKVREVGTAKWRRLPESHKTPRGLALDGPNEFIIGHENDYGPHGYVTLRFNGATLTEEFCSPNGKVLLSQVVG